MYAIAPLASLCQLNGGSSGEDPFGELLVILGYLLGVLIPHEKQRELHGGKVKAA